MSHRIPPPGPEPDSGQRYWRSLDQLADRPEFRHWLEREFPEGASEFTDPVSRRHFVKIMGASFLLMGLGLGTTGCRRPEERILPFSRLPEGYVHGASQFYATAMPARGSAIPLLVKSYEGRPVKIEGNAEHPLGHSATDPFAQAAILSLYDPDRAMRFVKEGHTLPRAEATDLLESVAKKLAAQNGTGLCLLMERSSSPSRERLQSLVSQKLPQAKWFVYEPVDLEASGAAASGWAGTPLSPVFKLDQARVILSLDADFIGAEEGSSLHIREFARRRKVSLPGDTMNRLYAVEGLMTQTGINADHRLRVPTSAVLAVAAALAAQLVPDNAATKALAGKCPLPAGVDPKWISECAADLAANKGACLVLAGHRQPVVVQALAHLINVALGNVGKTVQFIPGAPTPGTITQLAQLLNAGQVGTLVILGGNPVYNAPAELDWAATQRKAKSIIRLGYFEDETFAVSQVHLPLAHFLESWGDTRTRDGTLVPVQPLIQPLFGGMTELEVLARIGGLDVYRPYEIVRETFKGITGADHFEQNWKKFLHDGFWAGSAARTVDVQFAPERLAAALHTATAAAAPSKENLEVVFQRDYKMDDGRWNNNGWLQELPDPITKTVWDGVVLLSRKTAEEFAVRNEDVVEIELGGRKVRGPVWIQPGLADYSIGLALGYGRQKSDQGGTGRVGHQVGLYNAYQLRTSAAPYFTLGAKLRKTGETYRVSCTQEHGAMEGRPIVREANLEQFRQLPKFAQNMDLEAHADYIAKDPKTGLPKKIYEQPYRAFDERKAQSGVDLSKQVFKSDQHQWGMSVDLNTCVGCSACVLACQSENNVPIVGKEQVWRNREMHWLRIDRYYSGASDQSPKEMIDNPQVVTQPMFCQHCEDAPCESVCPVNATVHDEEGLNVMAYNRCVGTRYCSNNCPYKVRRFNFFDYNRRTFDQLKGPFYPSPLTSATDGEWNFKRWLKDPDVGTKPEDEWELLKLVRNPDVTVRMRGVMEKCTFCVQRIEGAKIAQKVKAGQSGDVQVPDGTIQTACQQACPAEAIVFGNLLDPNSRVSQIKKQERDYSVLGFLDTRPRVTYLAKLRNPNPKMPDCHEIPLNIKEYVDQQTVSPFEAHGPPGRKVAPLPGEPKGAH